MIRWPGFSAKIPTIPHSSLPHPTGPPPCPPASCFFGSRSKKPLQRHCIESYFAGDIGDKDETFNTKERPKSTIAVVSLHEFQNAFGTYCKSFVEWLAKQYKDTESKKYSFKPGAFVNNSDYYDNAGLKFQTDSNLDALQSFDGFVDFCQKNATKDDFQSGEE
jgi:hypothetical protein